MNDEQESEFKSFCKDTAVKYHQLPLVRHGWVGALSRAAQEKRGQTFEQWWDSEGRRRRREYMSKRHSRKNLLNGTLYSDEKHAAECAWNAALKSAV